MRYLIWTLFLPLFCPSGASCQTLKVRPSGPVPPSSGSVLPVNSVASVPLTVPVGTPLKVALNEEVRVRQVGQAVHGNHGAGLRV